jgi:hypothetical protein
MARFLEKAQRGLGISVLGEQKVNRLARLIDRAIQIPPLPVWSKNPNMALWQG